MKKILSLLLVCCMIISLAACGETEKPETTGGNDNNETHAPETEATEAPMLVPELTGSIVEIVFDGQNVTVDGLGLEENTQTDFGVFLSRDIVYYEEKTAYESGNPYGEGTEADMHSAEEAAAHLVINIIEPGSYRVSGNLELGQIRIDLGEDACESPDAVVNLILDGVTIECTVAPAILFRNVYECDGEWSVDSAQAVVDTAAAGANLILAEDSENTVTGSYVAKIFKDKDGEKKLWKQDGAIYSYMSMNVVGTGTLNLYAENEGLDSELHLTINGGNINIRSGNDGINTNEDGVSVTTINAGNVHIIAGLGDEGDGIDSNGYLVINGGTVVASANPAADAGLDSDMGSYINGGYVIALGSAMDWAESDSDQVTMNLQFARMQSADSSIVVAREDGTVVFAYDPAQDEVLGENVRTYMGAILSTPNFRVGDSYCIYIGSTVSGTETGGVYKVSTVTGFSGGTQQGYSGTDVMGGFGGMGNMGIPDHITPPDGWERPDGDYEIPENPGGMGPMGNGGQMPEDDFTMPANGEMPEGGFPGQGGMNGQGGVAEPSGWLFYMQDKVNFFSGLTAYASEAEPDTQ